MADSADQIAPAPVVTTIEIEKTHKNESKKKSASMNMHGVFLHVLADALGSIVVIISALIIKFVPHDQADRKHWTVYIDPTLSVIIVVIISISTISLFRETSSILLQTIPKHLEIQPIKSQLLKTVPEITSIHELHIWRLTNEKIIASAHLYRQNLTNYMIVADKVKKFFHSIGIHSVTIQYEYDDEQQTPLISAEHAPKMPGDCLLRCQGDSCESQTCCTMVCARSNTLSSVNEDNPSTTLIIPPHQYDNPILSTEQNLDSIDIEQNFQN
jgi:hypothetical protein